MTLVTLAMGRSVPRSRLHSSWPVAASARTAPLALIPLGAPDAWMAGVTDGLGLAVAADGRAVPLVALVALVASLAAGWSWPAADVQAVTPAVMTATAVSATIR